MDLNPGFKALLCRGGRGAGKSHLGAAFICTRAYYDPTSRGLISACDYPQLEKSTLVVLAEFCRDFKVPLYPVGDSPEETARMIAARRLCRIFDAQVVVLAGSKFGGTTQKSKQSGRGGSYRYAWLDEWLFCDSSSWTTFLASLGRGAGKLDGFALITSTLNINQVYNWGWNSFSDPERSDDLKRIYKELTILTADNDSLDPDFVATLKASYTPELQAIELRGEYAVSTDGRAFPYFDRARHVRPVAYDPTSPVLVSVDFNRHPATATLSQEYNGVIRVFCEFYLLHADTFKLGEAIARQLSTLSATQLTHVRLYGDATGNNKTANSNLTNWAIIHNALTAHQIPFARCYGVSNPPVVDTLNSTNCLFFQNRIEVDPLCKELIKDLETVKIDKDGKLDKSDLLRCQVVDGFRYLAHSLFPYRGIIAGGTVAGNPLDNPFNRRR